MKTFRDIIIIPTYNEKDNIGPMVSTIGGLYPDMEMWVVDDSSPDGTALVVSEMMQTMPKLRLIVRKAKTGLGDAYKETLIKIQKLDDVRHIVTMDADGSHNPLKIKELIDALEKYDLSIGSRYVRGGGGVKGMGPFRNFLSIGGNIYSRIIIGSSIHDSTAGFVAFRKEALANIDIASIASSGYSYQIEFKNTLLDAGKSFVEIPITFIDRKFGVSKMSGKIVKEGILAPWRIAFRKTFNKSRFLNTVKKSLFISTILLTLFFSLYRITESPPVWYDEGIYMQNADNLLHNGIIGARLSPEEVVHVSKFTVGYPLIYPLALVFKYFGTSVLSARLLMALFVLGLCLASYFLIRKSHGSNIALASLMLLASFPPLYGNGKSVLGEVPGLFFLILLLLCIQVYYSNSISKRRYIVLAGLCAGLAMVTKPIFLLLAPALVIALIVKWKNLNLKKTDIGIAIVSTLIPIALWIATQFQSGDSFATIFSFYANPYQISDLWSKIFTNIKGMFMSAGPLYLLIMTAVWIVSIFVRRRKGIALTFAELIAFVFSILCIAAYVRTSGMFRYIFPAQIISLIYFPIALLSIARSLGKDILNKISYAIFSLLILLGVYQLCFDSWVAEAYSSNKTTEWQNYFSEMSPAKSVFFYNTPEVAIFMKTANYYQYMEPAINLKIGEKQLEIIKTGKVDEIIIPTNFLNDVRDVKSGNASLFDKYRVSRTFYKYSVLNKASGAKK